MIKGIKSVDFKIIASGEGVVNWNGSFSLKNDVAGQFVNNHLLPKMRNVDPMRLGSLSSKELEKAKIFVSQNCIRNYIFKNENNNLKVVNLDNVEDILKSILGLVRGYVIADKITKLSLKRKSALLLEDFVAHDSIIRYEQFSNSGERNETSIFSKTQADKLNYISYGSISIEDLQFIVLEDSFGRSSYSDILDIETGKRLALEMTEFLKTLDFDGNKNPEAVFETNYVRVGGIMKDGEAGLLLNDDAIDLIVKNIIDRIENLYVRQSKGYLKVDEVIVDYNNGRALRIKDENFSILNNSKNDNYAVYYKNEEIDLNKFKEKMKFISDLKSKQKKDKSKSKNKDLENQDNIEEVKTEE